MPAARRLLVSAVPVAVLVAPTAGYAYSAPPKDLEPDATIALAGTRPPKATASQGCANADLMPAPRNVGLIRSALLCLHN